MPEELTREAALALVEELLLTVPMPERFLNEVRARLTERINSEGYVCRSDAITGGTYGSAAGIQHRERARLHGKPCYICETPLLNCPGCGIIVCPACDRGMR